MSAREAVFNEIEALIKTYQESFREYGDHEECPHRAEFIELGNALYNVACVQFDGEETWVDFETRIENVLEEHYNENAGYGSPRYVSVHADTSALCDAVRAYITAYEEP